MIELLGYCSFGVGEPFPFRIYIIPRCGGFCMLLRSPFFVPPSTLVDGSEKRECEWDECDHHDEHEDPVKDLVSGHFASGAVRVREEEPSP
jgi:hypothetical protein